MKFHCDRCQTRYSIADERVRGKILRIRCKNCSHVVTLRETGVQSAAKKQAAVAASPAATAQIRKQDIQPSASTSMPSVASSRSAAVSRQSIRPTPTESSVSTRSKTSAQSSSQLPASTSSSAFPRAGASAQANGLAASLRAASSASNLERSRPIDKSGPAPQNGTSDEWYLAKDGAQNGPFSLEAAKEWVAKHRVEDELFCWHEELDDWMSVDKVGHFDGLRAAAIPKPPQRQQQSGPSKSREPSPNVKASSADFSAFDGDALNLNFAEASRMVKLPDVMEASLPGPQQGGALPAVAKIQQSSMPSPAVSRGVSGPLDLGRPPTATKRRSRLHWGLPVGIGATVFVVVAGFLIYFAVSGDPEEGKVVARPFAGSVEGLGYTLDPITGQPIATKETTNSGQAARRSPRSSGPRSNNNREKTSSNNTAVAGHSKTPRRDFIPGEEKNGRLQPLSPSDVSTVSRKYRFGTKRCYESALKKDPFLKVRRLKVTLTVAPSGKVSSARVQGRAASSFLGRCLQQRIKGWRFRASSEGITTQFPIAFQQR